MISIAKLRQKGYKVYVRHERIYGQTPMIYKNKNKNILPRLYTKKEAEELSLGSVYCPLLAEGGKTTIEIYVKNIDGSCGLLLSRGEATCSIKDNYNKRLGVRIALGRALKDFQNSIKIKNE